MLERAPDGLDVVATRSEGETLSMPPLLILDVLADWLDEKGIGPAQGELSWARIGDGQSNITYLMERGTPKTADQFVLRRGPRPPLPQSTHDMVREARFQQVLAGRRVPVPKIRAVCQDESVLGVPFYVMEHVDGTVLGNSQPPSLDAAEARTRTSESVIDTLIALHSVDVTAPAVAGLGRPEGYLERQVKRFAGLWPQVSTRRLADFDSVTRRLAENVPPMADHTVVHGDYRLGNLMFDSDTPHHVLALLDWEMATLGDPLADLGYLTATWSDPAWPPTVMDHAEITRQDGWWRRADLAQDYAQKTGADLAQLPWYEALAVWKAAVFCEAMYTRWLRGERKGDTRFAPQLKEGVPCLLARAQTYVNTHLGGPAQGGTI